VARLVHLQMDRLVVTKERAMLALGAARNGRKRGNRLLRGRFSPVAAVIETTIEADFRSPLLFLTVQPKL
jgi:hypothetical protein